MSSRQFAIGRSSPRGSRYASKPEFLYRINSEWISASSIEPVSIVVNSTFGFFRFAKIFSSMPFLFESGKPILSEILMESFFVDLAKSSSVKELKSSYLSFQFLSCLLFLELMFIYYDILCFITLSLFPDHLISWFHHPARL